MDGSEFSPPGSLESSQPPLGWLAGSDRQPPKTISASQEARNGEWALAISCLSDLILIYGPPPKKKWDRRGSIQLPRLRASKALPDELWKRLEVSLSKALSVFALPWVLCPPGSPPARTWQRTLTNRQGSK